MAVSAQNLFNRSYHKIPRKIDVLLKVTAAADVNANGYTINYGSDLVESVAKNGEGVMDVTLKFPCQDIVGVQCLSSDTGTRPTLTSVTTGATPLVKITHVDSTDATTNGDATDPDSAVMFLTITVNTSSASVA